MLCNATLHRSSSPRQQHGADQVRPSHQPASAGDLLLGPRYVRYFALYHAALCLCCTLPILCVLLIELSVFLVSALIFYPCLPGDGGPLPEPADKGYGLYYIGAEKSPATSAALSAEKETVGAAGPTWNLPYARSPEDLQLNSRDRLLRYDSQDPDFKKLNQVLWDLCDLHEDDFDESLSLYDYLLTKELNPNMLKMAAAGFSNTLCSNSYELSLKKAVKWSRIWHAEG
jgi:hypothetical protein